MLSLLAGLALMTSQVWAGDARPLDEMALQDAAQTSTSGRGIESTDPAGPVTGLPEPLRQALEQAVPTEPSARLGAWHVRVRVRHNGRILQGRFDPAGEAGADPVWQVTSPQPQYMDSDQRALWRDLQQARSALFFVPDDVPIRPGSVRLVGQANGLLVYEFEPDLARLEGRASGYLPWLRGEITITENPPRLVRHRLYAAQAFRPSLAMRITRYEIVQEFGRLEGGLAPVAIRLTQHVEGRALLREFVDDVRVDFTHVPAKPD